MNKQSINETYAASLDSPVRTLFLHFYDIVRDIVPEATEETYYSMPAFKYKNKGLAAIIANQHFLSFYPFCAIDRLGLDLSLFECTSGSIHFSLQEPIADDLLRRIIAARKAQID